MDRSRLYTISAWCAFATLPALLGVATAGDQVIATVERPAVITSTSAPVSAAAGGAAEQSARLVVSVAGYTPPQDGGAVQVVVKAQQHGSGAEQEVGRFGVMLPTGSMGSSGVARYGLPLPPELADDGPLKLNVYLIPSQGDGKGARLEVGGAEIQ